MKPCLGLEAVNPPTWPTLMAGKCVLAIGGRPYFLRLPSFHGVLKIWQLTSSRVSNPKTKVEDIMSFMTSLVGHTPSLLQCSASLASM